MGEKDVQAEAEVREEDELERINRRIKELELENAKRKLTELENQARIAEKVAENLNDPSTQLKTPVKPVTRDPGEAYDELMNSRAEFTKVYGTGEQYNLTDPKGFLKCQIVLDTKGTKLMYPEKTDEEIRDIVVEKYKNELSML